MSSPPTDPIDRPRDLAAELAESEQRYRRIFEQSAVGICETMDGAQFVSANDRFCEMLGYTRGELMRLSPNAITHPGDLEATASNIASLRAGTIDGFTLEKRYLHKDGSTLWAQTAVSAVRDPSGGKTRVLAIVQDISARKRAEDEHRASEQRLRQALEAGNCGIYEWDVAADRVTWTDRLYRFFGMPPGAPLGGVADFAGRIHPDDRDAVQASVRRCLEQDTPHRMEYRVVRADGEIRWLFTHSSVIRDATGRPVRMLGACIDVTDRKAADEALRQSEDKYRTLTDAVGSLMWMSDASARLCFFNRRWEEFLGGDASQMLDLGWQQIVHPDDLDAVVRERTDAIACGRSYTVEYRLRRHDGQYRWHLARIAPHKDARGNILNWFGTATDIHDLKTAEEAVLRAKSEAEHANRAKDQFLAVLSHELRTPLTPVVMTVAALEMDRTLSPQVREDLAMIRRNIELETKLIDDLLDVTRIANGKLRLQPRPSDVHALARHVLEILKSDIADKRLNVQMDFSAADAGVSADPARLQQVFWNLVKNAVKFAAEGGRVTLRTSNPTERLVRLEVIDDGAGIDPAALPRIFNAFDQGEQGVTRQFGGLGLGLAISKALTELHGGTIQAYSEGKGCGACFSVELPARAPVERMVEQIQPMGSAGAGRPRVRILLVEDHADTQKTLRRLLEERGYEVLCASSVTGAVALLARESVDVLVSDIGLPDGSGHELMRRIRGGMTSAASHDARGPAGIPGIAISGFGMDGDLKSSQDAGFSAHLTKPVDVGQLDAMIRAMLREAGGGAGTGGESGTPADGVISGRAAVGLNDS